jgi:polysaccharide export outer membrane protein
LVFLIVSCAASTPVSIQKYAPSSSPATISLEHAESSLDGRGTAPLFTVDNQENEDKGRLAQLWQQRTQGETGTDYPLGPGDVLEVSVSALPEITNRVARVSGSGIITLPLIGKIQASGLTEEELGEEIRRRLEADYMYNPQVNLFVREYRSRQVAVLGAVERPGLYGLASDANTLLDILSLAGGMTREAAPRLHFIPAEPVEKEKTRELAATLPVQLVNQASPPVFLKRTNPLVIDLRGSTGDPNQLSLAIPARPGDVLMVPGAGDVLIEGWVARPGSYKITPDMTVLATVAAAGGPLFVADTNAVKIIRTERTGERSSFIADLAAVKRGEHPDIPVQDGDIIELSSSSPRLLPYGLYRLLTTVIHVGGSVPLY